MEGVLEHKEPQKIVMARIWELRVILHPLQQTLQTGMVISLLWAAHISHLALQNGPSGLHTS